MRMIAENYDREHIDERLEVVREVVRLSRKLEKLRRHVRPGTLRQVESEGHDCNNVIQRTERPL